MKKIKVLMLLTFSILCVEEISTSSNKNLEPSQNCKMKHLSLDTTNLFESVPASPIDENNNKFI